MHLPGVGEVRIVDLQDEASFDDGLVFFAHGVRDSEEIFLIGFVKFILHPVLHGARSHGGQKCFFNFLSLKRDFEIRDVGIHFLLADIFQRFHAIEDPRMMADGCPAAAVEILGELQHVAAENRSRLEIGTRRALDESAESFLRITGEIRFSQFAVVDDVDAALDLFLHDFGHGFAGAPSERTRCRTACLRCAPQACPLNPCGRAKLPTWVTRIRSVLVSFSSSDRRFR